MVSQLLTRHSIRTHYTLSEITDWTSRSWHNHAQYYVFYNVYTFKFQCTAIFYSNNLYTPTNHDLKSSNNNNLITMALFNA